MILFIAKAIAADPYLKKHKAPATVERQLYLKEIFSLARSAGRFFDTEGRERQTSSIRLHTNPHRATLTMGLELEIADVVKKEYCCFEI